MYDCTLIVNKQSTRLLHTLFGSQLFGVFVSDLAVNYVTFGSEHQKLVGIHDRHHDVIPLHRASERPFCVCQLLHFCKFLVKPNIDLELDCIIRKPMKRRFQRYIVRTKILSTSHARVEYIAVKNHVIETIGTVGVNNAKINSHKAHGPHSVQQCLGPPHSPRQTAARSLYALPHNYATKAPLITLCLTF